MSVNIYTAINGEGIETHGHFVTYQTQAGLLIRLLRFDERKPRVFNEHHNDWYDLLIVVEDNNLTHHAVNISLVYHPASFRNGEISNLIQRLLYRHGVANVRQTRDSHNPCKVRVTVRLWVNHLDIERKIGDFLNDVDVILPLTKSIQQYRQRCRPSATQEGHDLAA